jgi:hypothetical protein
MSQEHHNNNFQTSDNIQIQYTESSEGIGHVRASLPVKAVGKYLNQKLRVEFKSLLSNLVSSELPLTIHGSRNENTLMVNNGEIREFEFNKLSDRAMRLKYSRGKRKISIIFKFDNSTDRELLDTIFENVFGG